MKASRFSIVLLLLLGGCAAVPREPGPQQLFFDRLLALCGKAYEGRVVTSDEADREMAASRLTMHVRDCASNEIRIPFHVGLDRSRTWIISRTRDGLRLKHDHRHADGSEDVLSRYGGDTVSTGTARRQEFPADAFSKDLFRREGRAVSAANVWAVEVSPGRFFAYELRRPDRHFRVEFDLVRPVQPPPTAG